MPDSILGGAGAGALKGAALGSKLGTVLPGVGNLAGTIAGAGIGAISGGIKSGNALNKTKDAESFMPGYIDPAQSQRLAEIDRIAKNIQSGTDSATQTALGQANQTVANTQSRLSRVTGGNIGATTDALLKAQRAGGEAKNTAIAQGQSRLPYFMGLGQQMADRAEQRKLELQLLNRAQGMAEGAQAQKENVINRNATVASGLGMNELGGAGNRVKSIVDQIMLARQAENPQSNQSVMNPGTEVIGQSMTNLPSVLPGF